MATDVFAQRIPPRLVKRGTQLPFFSRHACPGSEGVDILTQNVAWVPGSRVEGCAFCFPPSLVGIVIQHLDECGTRAVVLVPAEKGTWPFVFHKWDMFTVEADFRQRR